MTAARAIRQRTRTIAAMAGRELGARPFRSVVLEADGHGRARVVKRFHHPNPLLAALDRRRARREFAALTALEGAGLAVPHPLEVRRGPRGWELVLAPVEGARTLREFLEPGASPPGGWPRLAAELARLLARLQAGGWRHGDLHAGNLLVDGAGRPWLIDCARTRRGVPDGRVRLAELTLAAGEARETLTPRLRARFLVAWLAALPRELRPGRPRPELARALEAAARRERRARVRAGLGRWLRESSRVRQVERAGASWLVRRDLGDGELDALDDGSRFVQRSGANAEVRARWLAAARLCEHRLPAARPAALSLGRGAATAAFELPRAGASDEGALRAALADRGLALGEAPAFRAVAGGTVLLPPLALGELDLGSGLALHLV